MEKRIQLKTHAVNVKWIARGESLNTVVVFLHEALGSVVQWKTFPEELCRELGLPGLVIERQGHGKSDPLSQPRDAQYLHDYTFDLKETLDEALPAGTKVLLIGHSDGGTIGLLYAKLFPKNVTGLVTMAAHTFVEPETLAGIAPAVDAFEQGKLDGLYRIHGDKTKELFYAWADTWRAPFFQSWDIRKEIAGITVPVLALQGSNDQYGTEEQLKCIAAAGNKIETILIKNCGHHPHIEKKDEVIRIIGRWFPDLR
jgi:pimeloyl-ACP methyl ester carboxylesterase